MEKNIEVMSGPNKRVRAHVNMQTLEMTIGVIELDFRPAGALNVINGGSQTGGYVQCSGKEIEKALLEVAEDVKTIVGNLEGYRWAYDDKRMEREMDAQEEAVE